MKKRIISFILTVVMVIVLVPTTMSTVAAEDATSGTCGENLTWTLEDGTLTISGEGKMEAHDSSTLAPWYYFADDIVSVVIEEGITSIDSSAFEGCTSLASITISDSVTSIGSSAFYNTAYYNDEGNWEDGVLYIDNWLITADISVVSGD